MQTLVDPFEFASRRLPTADESGVVLADLDVPVEEFSRPVLPPEESSARLRCWCSDEE
jgi:hypothetical protein